jgi:toxin ParE1/3/4
VKEAPVIWRPEARSDLLALYDWIAERADPGTALEYTSKVEAHAETLSAFPHRGTPHDEREPGFRTISYRRRTVIAYRVEDGGVVIVRIIHAGQDWLAE